MTMSASVRTSTLAMVSATAPTLFVVLRSPLLSLPMATASVPVSKPDVNLCCRLMRLTRFQLLLLWPLLDLLLVVLLVVSAIDRVICRQ